ncbi:hypothetical protein HUW62_31960 [Myxococcus sp. AM011]|uniref:hypothetical protein n=1 Tax=Myxococcus sp. AM011 TaxID=2745200 RepID=UPI001595E0A7|nr:hypothetical protein [Myxococcus sp. AM011]NVJ25848.1 hypothetical protein [Myxococcus sp. AM011]
MTTNPEEVVSLPTLYRGDSLPSRVTQDANATHRGRTFAEHYVTEGLLSKSTDQGLLADLNRPLEQLVAVHVGYRKNIKGEEYAAYHSPLISFSTDAIAAWHFLDRTAKKSFEECPVGKATHFMWKLTDVRARKVSPGRYRFEYRKSTKNVDKFREQFVNAVNAGDLSQLNQALATQIVHEHIQKDTGLHVAHLIDVNTFLTTIDPAKHNVDEELLARARKFGAKWSEWLLYPMEVEASLGGYSGRFSLNEALDLHLFAREVRPQVEPSAGPA